MPWFGDRKDRSRGIDKVIRGPQNYVVNRTAKDIGADAVGTGWILKDFTTPMAKKVIKSYQKRQKKRIPKY